MAPVRTFSAAAALLLSSISMCQAQTQLESCQDLIDAFELTKTQDVEVVVDQSIDISCANFTTMSMDSNTLTVLYDSEPTCSNCRVDLGEIRFEVTNGAKLFWEPRAFFSGTELRDVDGGAVFVGEGSSVRFYNDLDMADVGVRSLTFGEDFASYQRTAGCVYVDGYFVVDGDALFERSENSGGGESPPGPAGVMYVGETGSVLFNGEVTMREVSIIDNEGNNGAGIYNLGKINIKGNAMFEDLRAEQGGAIFNGEGAEFRFKNGATAVFNDCLSFDGVGGSVYNSGYLKFSGPALFLNSNAPTLYVSSTGYMRLSTDASVFWGNERSEGSAVLVAAGGRLTGSSKASFFDGSEEGCATVFYEDGSVCE
ncbi:unnamed protein product [Scytosiphon promiscuus]